MGPESEPSAHNGLVKSQVGRHTEPEFILHGPMLTGMDQPGILVAAINISEGRRIEVVQEIARKVAGGSKVLDLHSDPDHNRSVVTIAGSPTDIPVAALGIARACVNSIDLSQHNGVHPKLGAIDVVPFAPNRGSTLEDCIGAAKTLGHLLADDLDLPCFLYELASAERRTLPEVRRQAFGTLFPDIGPHAPHPTAGATCIGARGPMVAFNVELETRDLALAKGIAVSIRRAEGGLRDIRALAFPLESRRCVQVSMNLVNPFVSTPALALAEVERLATLAGIRLRSAEVIGLAPTEALVGAERDRIYSGKPSLEEALNQAFGPLPPL